MYFLIDNISSLHFKGESQGYPVWNSIAGIVGNLPFQNYLDENWVWLYLVSQALITNGKKIAFSNAIRKLYWVSYENKIALMTLKQNGSMNQEKIASQHGLCSVQASVPGRSWLCQTMVETLALPLPGIRWYYWCKERGSKNQQRKWGSNHIYSQNLVPGSFHGTTDMSHFFLRVVVK